MKFSGYAGEYIVEDGDAERLTAECSLLVSHLSECATALNKAIALGDAIALHCELRSVHELMLAHLSDGNHISIELASEF